MTPAATTRPAMTDPTELDERLAQLAARRAASAQSGTPTSKSKRLGHKARIGRVVAAGLSSSAFFSIVGVLAANATSNASTVATARPNVPINGPTGAIATSTTRTTVVVKVVHHKRYVDPNGKPVSPPTTNRATGAAAAPSGAGASSGSGSGSSAGSSGTTHTTTGGAPVTTGHAPTGGGSAPAPPAPTPAPTTPPTRPAAPPTTVFTPPAPPPPPPCTGSKCPH
jgi:hypothetical protein